MLHFCVTLLLLAAAQASTFGQAADDAEYALTHVYYAGSGLWRDCDLRSCRTRNVDWGSDSATYTLYLRWSITHEPAIKAIASELLGTAPRYPAACTSPVCGSWSDVPEWDAVALLREYQITRDPRALALAKRAFEFVRNARVFALGACPQVPYQVPGGGAGYLLKTLETGANYLKAALLLYASTRDRGYLDLAVRAYARTRHYFLDPAAPLYSVYVFDDGRSCTQLPQRFFASVNGDMIWSGVMLTRFAGSRVYLAQAIATARAVDRFLSDGRGVFTDLQAENDVEEPLIEAMYDLAVQQHQAFAREWILRNAAAAINARAPSGVFERFFDGPPPQSHGVSIWQSNGGLALEIAAGALEPGGKFASANPWNAARFVPHDVNTLPSTIAFYGSGIAFIGTMGERCCEAGHARVFVDGIETFDRTGIWQNKSMTGSVVDTVLFAWRWHTAARHAIRFEPGLRNAKEGGPFLHLRGYYVIGQ